MNITDLPAAAQTYPPLVLARDTVASLQADIADVQAQIDAVVADAAATGADHRPDGRTHRYRRVTVPEEVRLTGQRTELEALLRQAEAAVERLARPALHWAKEQA
jgi:hypothetical protein